MNTKRSHTKIVENFCLIFWQPVRRRIVPMNKAPERIQRKGTMGWRTPPNTVYVGRPTKWGNPFSWGVYGRKGAVEMFVSDKLCGVSGMYFANEIALELEGKNLACWCPLDDSCHADLLLEIANGGNDE